MQPNIAWNCCIRKQILRYGYNENDVGFMRCSSAGPDAAEGGCAGRESCTRERRSGHLPWSGGSYLRTDGEGGTGSARLPRGECCAGGSQPVVLSGQADNFEYLSQPCALSVRQFNARASKLENTVVLCLSMDLPFAQSRFCTTEGLDNVVPLSLFRSHDFVEGYGLRLVDGPLEGLMARAVIVVDEAGKVRYTQLVKVISDEPDYEAALNALL